MKRLLLASIALIIIAIATYFVVGSDPQISPEVIDKLKRVSRFKETLPKAETGDAKAQFELAEMYESGDGTKADMQKAVEWTIKSADQGYPDGQYKMGWMYANGIGLRQDYAAAAKWYRLAATFHNHTEAQFRLGELYFNGRGVEHDYGKAIQYYTQAASKGHAAAQYLLGSMHYEGWGVKRDVIVGYMWLKMASAHQAEALAVNKKYDPLKMLEKVKASMNNFQIEEAEKRLVELAKLR
ncbi:MAG TPA: tetratricopeptide repeat protein [Magnetovibrio sp.]